MLQELGVLPPKNEEYSRQRENLEIKINPSSLPHAQAFLAHLQKTKRAKTTLLGYLLAFKNFTEWLAANEIATDLLSVHRPIILRYLDFLSNSKLSYQHSNFVALRRFYCWLKYQKLVMANPCTGIHLGRSQLKLCIIDDDKLSQIVSFIKNPATDPEQAFLIALVLFFGLTTEDLRFAKLMLQNNVLCLVLRRKATTAGHQFYNRDQILKFPTKPDWFLPLQRRFYKNWLEHFLKIKRSYPHEHLLLPYHNHYCRPLSDGCVTKRFQKATLAACGLKIPPRILRQTCGHLHTKNGDASALTQLGWSPQFAFHYTWLPRTFFSTMPKNSSLT
jgi:site-specific recombinase XerC